ncbi:MAG: methylmalonyl-CoA decarboxylase [Magnetospiraceae bacterium]
MSLIHADLTDHVGTIVMQNKSKLNALSEDMIDEIIAAAEDFRRNDCRVLVLRADPGVKIWSAGHDVHELPTDRRDPLGWSDPLRKLIRMIEEFPTPVIAQIEGGVWGGACEVALVCDLVVATPNATFAVTPAKLGVPYNVTGVLTFMNAVDSVLLKEMVFTAQPIDAKKAERHGIINYIVAPEEIDAFTGRVCTQIKKNAPLSISVIKEQIRILSSAASITPRMFERVQGLRRVVYDSEDYKEGINAFLEKRAPNFTGK